MNYTTWKGELTAFRVVIERDYSTIIEADYFEITPSGALIFMRDGKIIEMLNEWRRARPTARPVQPSQP